MNLGDLVAQARAELHGAAQALGEDAPLDTVDVLTLATARSTAYTALTRWVRIIAAGAVTIDLDQRMPYEVRAVAEGLLSQRGQAANKLYAALRAAADTGGYPATSLPNSAAARHLVRAADLIGAGADLLAGHLPANALPRTPEGVAMRSGAALRAGLATIGRLALDLVGIDEQLPGWLTHRDATTSRFSDKYIAILRGPRWTPNNGLPDLARALIVQAPGAPPLGQLQPAPVSEIYAPTNSRDLAARVDAVTDWLQRHPDLVDATHLRAATRLGLAVSGLASNRPASGWREAMTNAIRLNSAPTSGEVAQVAVELADLAASARDLRRDGRKAPIQVALSRRLPRLADLLRHALATGVQRGTLLVAEAGLSPQPIKLVYRYRTTSRPATATDSAVAALDRALTVCARDAVDDHGDSRRSTALAFPGPPRPGSPVTSASPLPIVPSPRHQTRHR